MRVSIPAKTVVAVRTGERGGVRVNVGDGELSGAGGPGEGEEGSNVAGERVGLVEDAHGAGGWVAWLVGVPVISLAESNASPRRGLPKLVEHGRSRWFYIVIVEMMLKGRMGVQFGLCKGLRSNDKGSLAGSFRNCRPLVLHETSTPPSPRHWAYRQ